MEALIRGRRPVRYRFNKLCAELDGLLKVSPLEVGQIEVLFKLLNDVNEELQLADNKVKEQLIIGELGEVDEETEYDEMAEFRKKYETIRFLKEKLCPSNQAQGSLSSLGGTGNEDAKIRRFKLPQVIPTKFSGELKDWLKFWGQFRKIHEDQSMEKSDKFYYLMQYLKPNTEAFEIAYGYPQSDENYDKVIDAMKRRYGNEDLQLQVYLRELLNIVITNVKAKEKISLKSLYLKLDSHLRALQTLNLEKADPATWLFPLVESCLPEEMLGNWQRNSLSTHDGSKDDPPRNRLELLMEFLEKEVGIMQRNEIARNFANNLAEDQSTVSNKSSVSRRGPKRPHSSTMSSFHAGDTLSCAFCGKTNHKSPQCFKAKRMTNKEKIDILKEKHLCFNCCGNHMGRHCKEEGLKCEICNRRHYTVLCREYKSQQNQDFNSNKRKKSDADSGQLSISQSNFQLTADVALQTLFVRVRNGNKVETLRAFIDSGSQRSYITTSAARRLKLESKGVEQVIHSIFGGRTTGPVTHNIYDITVEALQEPHKYIMEVREQRELCGLLPHGAKVYPSIYNELHEKGITLIEVDISQVDLLIGADMYTKIITGDVYPLNCGAVGIRTKLGWTVLGKISQTDNQEAYVGMSVTNVAVSKLWELEALGIRCPDQEKETRLDPLAIKEFRRNVSRDTEGRYIVKMPWKDNVSLLSSNKEVAFKRLQGATRNLLQKGLYAQYDAVLKAWEQEGFIERMSAPRKSEQVHYLPHRPVVKNSPTTPVRPVFDASSRQERNLSLNDCLHTGANYIHLIFDILVEFRRRKVAYWADIRKAFQMVGVVAEDRDLMRFLWWNENTDTKPIEYRHARVMFGATCSPFILAAIINIHLQDLPEIDKELGTKLMGTFYIDNCIGSVDTEEEYHQFRKDAIRIMNEAKMDLRMWLSNIDEFEDESTHTISGMMWNRKADELSVKFREIKAPEVLTKRTILSTIQKIYDPLGLVCPAVIPIKVLLQQTWKLKLKWDQPLPEKQATEYTKWCQEVNRIGEISIPRMVTGGEQDTRCWKLITFTDASNHVFSAVVFLKVKNGKNVTVQLVSAKARVVPVKEMTIPRKELVGCLIGARLCHSVKKAWNVTDIAEEYRTDSMTALSWIKRNDQWGTFVANRTRDINRLTDANCWKHIPSKENPADLPSRGCGPYKLLNSQWWNGPKWLSNDEADWHVSVEKGNEDEVRAELLKSARLQINFSVVRLVRKSHSYKGFVRITGWVRRFLHNYLIKDKTRRKSGDLSNEEIYRAELVMLKNIQKEEFLPDDVRLKQYETIQDEWGLIRVKTRLTYLEEPKDFRFPIFLPHNRAEIRQLIHDLHWDSCHAGAGYIQTELRKKFWVLRARRTVKSIVTKCFKCRRFSAKACIPEPAPLPLDRIKQSEVFEVVGVDLAGPLLLKNGQKVWLVIFTCAVYRAVHFEVVRSLGTRAFINVLGKFIEKFRRPNTIYSDNGTNFRGTDNLFKKLDWDKITNDSNVKPITFKFSPAHSSWWGGFWERLIRTAKDMLKRTVGKATLNYEELKAVLKTVGEVMNGRPLTYVSEDQDDLEPLTPSLFLHPFGSTHFPEGEITDAERLRIRYKYVTTLRQELKSRFRKEYLSLLVNRRSPKATRKLKIGELVLIGSDNVKRTEWPLGKIVELIPGKDEVTRVAKIKTEKGEIVRSVQRLYPLELDLQDDVEKSVQEKGTFTRSGRKIVAPTRFQ